ncbi:hypothetical protein F0562_023472 [Nyssa sinensis]|uniref:YLP motif-containing protein 1 n=1 Tax=Nyssa sinensis TaxID=561372 RepID=A0A5J5BL14_9ASTE|nr:hypothetical protein F0562_023472 [Nyssa sinensis]
MDHSWRLRPPVQGNICPTCSISHFPFCHPHPSFNQNPRFQTHHDHSFERPFFDPFLDHRGPTAGLHRPFVENPIDGFGDPRAWHRDSNLQRESGEFHGQSQIGDSGMVTGFLRDGFTPPGYDHGNVGFKRMRVDETGMGSFMNENHVSSFRISTENERILRLIRDHGGASSGTPQGGVNSVLGMSSGFNFETNEYALKSSVLDKNFSSRDGGEHRKFDELLGNRNEMTLEPPRNFDTNNFQDPGFGNFDRKGTSVLPEPGFNPHSYGEEHGLAFASRYTRINRNEELGQSRYGQVENSLHPSLPTNGHSGLLAGGSTNVKQGRQVEDVAALYHEGVRYNSKMGDDYVSTVEKADLNRQSHVSHSQSVRYPTLEVPNKNYYDHKFQRGYPVDSWSTKEPDHWQGLSGLNTQYHEQIGTIENCNPNSSLPQPYTMQAPLQPKHDFQSPGHLSDMRKSFEVNVPSQDGNQGLDGHGSLNKQGGYLPIPSGSNLFSENMGRMQASRVSNVQPPLPASPPPPLPLDPPRHPMDPPRPFLSEPYASSSPSETSSTLFPIPMSSSATLPSSHPLVPEHFLAQPLFHNKQHLHASTGFATEESQSIQRTSSKQYLEEGRPLPLRHLSSDKPKVIDASRIFKQPHRVNRPDHIVIILRGLPGSGKSYLAKMLRDLEVENGGGAPRIHSMDDYFMTEVEKVEDSDVSKSSGSVRGKKPVMKKVMEYCYEPEMEEAYRSSMLKAFKKTLEEGVFSFIIVDDRNLRVADFAQFWATAKRSGYEVYLLEATYKDPVGCAARNVHGFTQDDIQRMARQWEEDSILVLEAGYKVIIPWRRFEGKWHSRGGHGYRRYRF